MRFEAHSASYAMHRYSPNAPFALNSIRSSHMRLHSQTIVALLAGVLLYWAFGPTIEMCHGFVDSLVLAEILSRTLRNDSRYK